MRRRASLPTEAALCALALFVALPGCQAAEAPPADEPEETLSVATIPANFVGRYEIDAQHCAIPDSERVDGEFTPQGGAMVRIEPASIYFVEWIWPVQGVEVLGDRELDVRLLNDVDGDGSRIEIEKYRLKLDADDTLTVGAGVTRYSRCPEERNNA